MVVVFSTVQFISEFYLLLGHELPAGLYVYIYNTLVSSDLSVLLTSINIHLLNV